MRRTTKMILVIFIVLCVTGCKERFDPNLTPRQSNYLVVEGFINANGFTNITLRRTVPLKDTAALKNETNAQVSIIAENNSVYPLTQQGNGAYGSNFLILNTNQKYRLHIKTSTGGEYLSEFVPVRKTPPIDNISWELQDGGVRIYANTHDPLNNTRYYKWEYEETWEIHSTFLSEFAYTNDDVISRPFNERAALFYCWQNERSSSIITASTVRLSNDVVSKQPILVIPKSSVKTSVRYSILVRQYSLDKQSYDFYELVKKTTESLGSLFDSQPSEFTGNIVCVSNPNEKVIGFMAAGTAEQKRIFLTPDDIGGSTYRQNCETVLVANNKDSFRAFYGIGTYLPYAAFVEQRVITHYYSSSPECIDCRLRGTNVKPSFW